MAALPPLRGVIFDLGGTLIYPTTTDEHGIRSLAAWLRAQGWPADVEDAIRQARRWVLAMTAQTGRQHTMAEGIRQALARCGRPAPDDGFVHEAEQVFFGPELAGYRPFPHAHELLRRLQAAGLRTGCISNATSHWLVERIVDQMGFRPYLDPVVSSAAFGRTKPDPHIFRSVLDRWGIPPQEAAMVGDTLAADIAGGAAAGMRTLYVTMQPHPGNARSADVRADAEAATLEEAERILLEWAGRG
ncbi:MAG: HAD family hydrolase [Armatimonadota bacterium]|nr:HAD family hydrolase [Armatimonadota bacterium]